MSTPLVLISDDDMMLANSMVRVARSAGLRAFSDTSSRVLDLAVRYHPDVVLLDLRQEVDGRELLAEMKRDRRTKGIRVVMFSGSVDEEVKDACLKLGAADWLLKPVPMSFFSALATEAAAPAAEESVAPVSSRVVVVGGAVAPDALLGQHEVLCVPGPEEALELCGREQVHVLVCEEPADGPGGVELVIRARALCKALRGVVLADASNYFKASQLDRVCGSQMLLQPCAPQTISDAVRRAARLSLGYLAAHPVG